MKETTILDDQYTFEEFGFIPLFAQSQPKTGDITHNLISVINRPGAWHFGNAIGIKEFQVPLALIESNDLMKEEKIDKIVNFFVDSKGNPRAVKIAFRRAPDKFIWAFFQSLNEPSYTDNTVDFVINFIQPDPYRYGLSNMYDVDKPLRYDEGNNYGVQGYPNTKSFKWNIVPHHYAGIENYSNLDTDIKITIQGTVRGGSITHLPTNQELKLPNITNGTIVVDTETFNMTVNGQDIMEFDGDYFEMVPGNNGFLFKAEQANATVNFDWLHRFM